LTTLFGNSDVPAAAPIASDATTPKKKHSMLPILTLLFLVSYGLMTLLIVEQGSTIESQRALIRELFRDSRELSAMKGKALQERRLAEGQNQAQASGGKTPSNQVQSNQGQSNQAQGQAAQTPSTRVAPQQRAQSKTEKVQKPLFAPPSKPASDQAENRRALIVI
jgi:hypothetical protein